jgi:hypothetical protein
VETQGKAPRSARGGLSSGFSDTLWYGEDHFTGCHHLEGLRAVVRYKPSEDRQFDGDTSRAEYRENLPTALNAKAGIVAGASLAALTSSVGNPK